ncbi:MAG: MFS transporter [Chitinophagales bacterium]|nr:MFS transporter [Chitinophagales bacterium]
MKQKTNYPALYLLVIVFFFWGFIAAGNNIFIPFCKFHFKIDQFQSQMVDFAFYGAYYIGAIGLFFVGQYKSIDLVGYWGYKKTIVYGLILSFLGVVSMSLFLYLSHFIGILIGLFIVGLGFSLQQTAANPLAIALGDKENGETRINLAGGINSFGTMIGPIIVSKALFGTTNFDDTLLVHLNIQKVIFVYLGLGSLFLFAALIFQFSKSIPNQKLQGNIILSLATQKFLCAMTLLFIVVFVPIFYSYYHPNILNFKALGYDLDLARFILLISGLIFFILLMAYAYRQAPSNESKWGAMSDKSLNLGMLGIFVYVGVEVAIGSNLSEYITKLNLPEINNASISMFISLYWGSLMIGRWIGSIDAFSFAETKKKIAIFLVPVLAFSTIIIANKFNDLPVSLLYPYIFLVIIKAIIYYLFRNKSSLYLMVNALFGIVLLITGLITTNYVSIFAFVGCGLFLSTMWPSIFNLAVKNLEDKVSQGSSMLIMMILGGAIIPPIQGKLADIFGIHSSFAFLILGFLYIAVFAFMTKNTTNETR